MSHTPSYDGDRGAQNPTLESNSDKAKGTGYEVYSIDDRGHRKRHQVWQDRAKAYGQVRDLKKLFGDDIKLGIREVTGMKGGYAAAVKKCQALLGKAVNQPPVAGKKVGMVTGAGKVMTGKSPKVSGHVSTKLQIGTTQSGKTIHNDPHHEAHAKFTSADHMDSYRAHAKQLSHLDPKETHPSIVEHHKQSLNTHFKLGTGGGVKKGFANAVAACADLLKAGEGSRGGKVIGHTQSGKPVYEHSSGRKNDKWDAQDHADAAAVHRKVSGMHGSKAAEGGKAEAGHQAKADHHESESSEHDKARDQAKTEGDSKSAEEHDKAAEKHAEGLSHTMSARGTVSYARPVMKKSFALAVAACSSLLKV